MLPIILTALSRAVTASSSIVLTWILASKINPHILGSFFIAQSAVLLTAQFPRLGMDRQIIVRNARRRRLQDGSNVLELFLFSALGGILGSAAAVVLVSSAPLIIYLYNDDVAGMVARLAPAIPGFTVLLLVSAWLKSEQRAEVAVFFEIGGVNIMMLLIFVVLTRDITTSFVGAVFTLLLLAAGMTVKRLAHIFRKKNILRHLRNAFRHVHIDKALGSLNILLFIGINMSMLLGGILLQTNQIAELRVAERLAFAVAFPLIVQSSILPTRFAREVHRTGQFSVRNYAPYLALYTLASIGAVAAISTVHAGQWLRLDDASYGDWFHLWKGLAAAYVVATSIGPTESVAAALGYGRIMCIIVLTWLIVYGIVAYLLGASMGSNAVVCGYALYIVGMRLSSLAVIAKFLSLRPG
jgi:hypothetical protein